MAHKKVYMIRHGKTPGNIEKRYIGSRTDEELSLDCIKEIQDKLSSKMLLTPDDVDRICTSPMRRAIQTAELLFDDPDIQIVEALKEIDFGVFEGKNYEELNGNEIYQSWIDSNGTMDIPEGEGRDAFIKRSYEGFLDALGDRSIDETIAIVCHGGNIMSVMSRLTGEDYYDFMTETLGGYILELETDDEGTHVISYHKLGAGDNS
ncbi:alpha-ribazole phosphatase [Lachnospiraceae bacterium NE2001]|nr:alpha-ribazole phosphatase [Lachnospiraceae bacterium NE2001]